MLQDTVSLLEGPKYCLNLGLGEHRLFIFPIIIFIFYTCTNCEQTFVPSWVGSWWWYISIQVLLHGWIWCDKVISCLFHCVSMKCIIYLSFSNDLTRKIIIQERIWSVRWMVTVDKKLWCTFTFTCCIMDCCNLMLYLLLVMFIILIRK